MRRLSHRSTRQRRLIYDAVAATDTHPTAEWVPNIEPPINMSLTGAVDPVAAPLLGEHTEGVLLETLGYDERRIATLVEKGAFGLRKTATSV